MEELRQKGVDKSCPLCRKPLTPGPEKLFEWGVGIYAKIKGAIDRSRPGVDERAPWPALSTEQQGEILDQIEYQVQSAAEHIDEGNDHVKQAIEYQKSIRKKQCCLIVIILIILIIILFSLKVIP